MDVHVHMDTAWKGDAYIWLAAVIRSVHVEEVCSMASQNENRKNMAGA